MQKLTRFSLCIFAAALALAALLAAVAPAARAAELCVDPTGIPCYSTIQAAVNAAASGDTINIHAGTYHENVTVNKTLAFVGAGAGQTIVDGSGTGRVFYVTADGVSFSTLTVQNGNAAGDTFDAGAGGGIYAGSGSDLTLTDVDVLSSTSWYRGGGVVAWKNRVTVTGGRFENNRGGTDGDRYGGGLYAQYTLVVSGTRFISNTIVGGDGGGAYGNGATTITNSQFTGNTAGSDGGGLYGYSTAVLLDTRFLGNTAEGGGGGAYVVGEATVAGGLFQDNLAVMYDGGGLATDSALTLTGTQFLSNTGQMRGGGVYAGSAATVNGGLFQNNHTNQFEGGGLAAWSTLALSGTQFIGNASTYDGGGAFAQGAATVTGGLFQNNRTTFDDHSGGGLATNSTLALTDTQFVGNASIWNGGGAYAAGAVTLAGGRFENNSADRYGGGLYADNTLALAGTRFISNTAAVNGGGLMLGSGAGRVVNAVFARNSAGSAGAAMYLLDPAGLGGSAQVIHTTIASPTVDAGPGQAIVVGNGAVGITNTILANYAAGVETAISGTATSDYNLFYNAPTSVVIGSHSITDADPLLVNLAGGDYHLAVGSPAIDNGMDAGITTDLDGVTRPQGARYDIGAFEFDSPFLTLAKTVTPTVAISYQGAITYTIVLSNIGVVNDAAVLMTDTLPAPVGFDAWVTSPPAGTILSDKTIMWTGSVAAGQVLTWTFTATQTGDAGEVITNTAHFSSTRQSGDAAAAFKTAGPDRTFIFLPAILKN